MPRGLLKTEWHLIFIINITTVVTHINGIIITINLIFFIIILIIYIINCLSISDIASGFYDCNIWILLTH